MPETELLRTRVEALTGEVGTLAAEISGLGAETKKLTAANLELAEADRSARHRIAALAVMAVVILALVIGMIVNAVRVDRADSRASRVAEYQVTSCEQTNVTRAEAKTLWDDIDKLILGLNNTAANRRFVAALQARVDKIYAQRPCPTDEGKTP